MGIFGKSKRNGNAMAGAAATTPLPAAPTAPARSANESQAFGHYLISGNQDVTLADPDALRTVMAQPNLEVALAAFEEEKKRAMAIISALDFTNEAAAHSSMATLLSTFDRARRKADYAITQQYEREMSEIDRREASWNGVKVHYEHELALLEQELAGIEAE